jgi:hypothetical protein
MMVATVVLEESREAEFEHDVAAFLNSPVVLRWAEGTLGL